MRKVEKFQFWVMMCPLEWLILSLPTSSLSLFGQWLIAIFARYVNKLTTQYLICWQIAVYFLPWYFPLCFKVLFFIFSQPPQTNTFISPLDFCLNFPKTNDSLVSDQHILFTIVTSINLFQLFLEAKISLHPTQHSFFLNQSLTMTEEEIDKKVEF